MPFHLSQTITGGTSGPSFSGYRRAQAEAQRLGALIDELERHFSGPRFDSVTDIIRQSCGAPLPGVDLALDLSHGWEAAVWGSGYSQRVI